MKKTAQRNERIIVSSLTGSQPVTVCHSLAVHWLSFSWHFFIASNSAIGPASFVVNAADLTSIKPGNLLAKYADDTYLIVPASNVDSRSLELENIEKWAKATCRLRTSCSPTWILSARFAKHRRPGLRHG